MKIQNNKTKTATTIMTAIIIGLVLLSPTTVIPNVNAQMNISTQIPQSPADIEKLLPKPLSKGQIESLQKTALSNDSVQNIIAGKPYRFMAADYVGNIVTGIANPEVHFNISNKTEVTVVENLETGTITDIKIGSIQKLAGPVPPANGSKLTTGSAARAVDDYTGTHNIDGLIGHLPTSLPGFSASTLPQVSYLLNGIELNANDDPAYACNSNYYYYNYFAQGGVDWGASNPHIVYADTLSNCYPVLQYSVDYNPGKTYLFEIWVTRGTYNWNIYGEDMSNGKYFWYQNPNAVAQNTMKKNDVNTSVWFENHETGTSWYNDFSPTTVSANTIQFHDFGGNYWQKWDNDAQSVIECSGLPGYQNVITGNLINGNTANWDLIQMAQHHC